MHDVNSLHCKLMNVCLETISMVHVCWRNSSNVHLQKLQANDNEGWRCLLRCCGENNQIAIYSLNSFLENNYMDEGLFSAIEMYINNIVALNQNVSEDVLPTFCLFSSNQSTRMILKRRDVFDMIINIKKTINLQKSRSLYYYIIWQCTKDNEIVNLI